MGEIEKPRRERGSMTTESENIIVRFQTKVKIECEGEETTWPIVINYEVRRTVGGPVVEVKDVCVQPSQWLRERFSPEDCRMPFPLYEITGGLTDSVLDGLMIRQWQQEEPMLAGELHVEKVTA
jgi:hypothetical protein